MASPTCRAPASQSVLEKVRSLGHAHHLRWSPVQQTVATTAGGLLSSGNILRRGIVIQNPAASSLLWINFGAPAANGMGIFIAPLATLTWIGDDCPVEDIYYALYPGPIKSIINFMEASL